MGDPPNGRMRATKRVDDARKLAIRAAPWLADAPNLCVKAGLHGLAMLRFSKRQSQMFDFCEWCSTRHQLGMPANRYLDGLTAETVHVDLGHTFRGERQPKLEVKTRPRLE